MIFSIATAAYVVRKARETRLWFRKQPAVKQRKRSSE